jgi:hypothetical protein
MQRIILSFKAVTSLEQIHPNNLAIVTDKVVSLPSGETRLNAH